LIFDGSCPLSIILAAKIKRPQAISQNPRQTFCHNSVGNHVGSHKRMSQLPSPLARKYRQQDLHHIQAEPKNIKGHQPSRVCSGVPEFIDL